MKKEGLPPTLVIVTDGQFGRDFMCLVAPGPRFPPDRIEAIERGQLPESLARISAELSVTVVDCRGLGDNKVQAARLLSDFYRAEKQSNNLVVVVQDGDEQANIRVVHSFVTSHPVITWTAFGRFMQSLARMKLRKKLFASLS